MTWRSKQAGETVFRCLAEVKRPIGNNSPTADLRRCWSSSTRWLVLRLSDSVSVSPLVGANQMLTNQVSAVAVVAAVEERNWRRSSRRRIRSRKSWMSCCWKVGRSCSFRTRIRCCRIDCSTFWNKTRTLLLNVALCTEAGIFLKIKMN